MQPLTLKRLKAYRAQAKTVQKQFQLKNDAQALWPYVSDNDILNKNIGLSAVEYRFEHEAQGGSRTSVRNPFWKRFTVLPIFLNVYMLGE